MGHDLPEMVAKARRCEEDLSAWDGGGCKVEQYHGGTHPNLRLWVFHEGKPHSLSIVCWVPVRMSGPFGWSGCALRVAAEEYSRPKWPGPVNMFVLRDLNVDFRLICCNVAVDDGGPPPHWIRKGPESLPKGYRGT